MVIVVASRRRGRMDRALFYNVFHFCCKRVLIFLV